MVTTYGPFPPPIHPLILLADGKEKNDRILHLLSIPSLLYHA